MAYINSEVLEMLSNGLFIAAAAAFLGGAVIGYPVLCGKKNPTREGTASSLMTLSFVSAIGGGGVMTLWSMGIWSDYSWFYDAAFAVIISVFVIGLVISAFLLKTEKTKNQSD